MDHLLQNYLVCQCKNRHQCSFQSYWISILRSVVWVSTSFKIVPRRCFNRLRCKNHPLKWREKTQLGCGLSIAVTLLQTEAEGSRHMVSTLCKEVEPRSELGPLFTTLTCGGQWATVWISLSWPTWNWVIFSDFWGKMPLEVAEENWVLGSLWLQKMH